MDNNFDNDAKFGPQLSVYGPNDSSESDFSGLLGCPFCAECEQLEVRTIDYKNPDRDIVRCRNCGGNASRVNWQQRATAQQLKAKRRARMEKTEFKAL